MSDTRIRAGELLVGIAAEQQLDSAKVAEFETILASAGRDRLLGMAADELTEYCLTWQPKRNVLGVIKEARPKSGDLEGYRQKLDLFGRALIAGIRDFKSADDIEGLLRRR